MRRKWPSLAHHTLIQPTSWRPESCFSTSVMGLTNLRQVRMLLVAALTVLGCGGKEESSAGSASAGAGGGSKGGMGRVPAQHRASGSTCAGGRAPINPTPVDPMCSSEDSSVCAALFTCTQDKDCIQGANGRCSGGTIGPRRLSCSYDACQSDGDCANNAPCECRASASDTAANECISTSNCRVDADCGENNYCSPSQLGGGCFCPSAALCGADAACSPGPCVCGDACGHGYFCHTPTDACVDDSDCGTSGSCNYDTVNQRWACSECWPVP